MFSEVRLASRLCSWQDCVQLCTKTNLCFCSDAFEPRDSTPQVPKSVIFRVGRVVFLMNNHLRHVVRLLTHKVTEQRRFCPVRFIWKQSETEIYLQLESPDCLSVSAGFHKYIYSVNDIVMLISFKSLGRRNGETPPGAGSFGAI